MKFIKILSIIFALAFIVNSCDKVTEPYQTGFDCETGNQKVLIEDYTGHTCVNCPSATVTAHNIKQNCEDRVIIIAVHAGFFSEPRPSGTYTYDFRTEAGNEWNKFFGIEGNPNGLVNRLNEEGNYVLGPGLWAEATIKLLEGNSPVEIVINSTFDVENNKLITKIDAEVIGNIEGDYSLIVCITEDHIIKPQKNNDPSIGIVGDILDYEHNDVLRGSINGNWGETFIVGGTSTGNTISKTYEQSFDDTDWVVENCKVVAFIFNEADKSVLQVEEAKVVQ